MKKFVWAAVAVMMMGLMLVMPNAYAGSLQTFSEMADGYRVVQSDIKLYQPIALLLKNKDGTMFFRIAELDYQAKWGYTDTGTLPENSEIMEVTQDRVMLCIGAQTVTIERSDRYDWAIYAIENEETGKIQFGYDYVVDGSGGRIYGNHPWNGPISQIDFLNLPKTREELMASVDQTCWGRVCSDDGSAWLYREGEIVAELYAAAPVQILSTDEEWTQIQIGDRIQGFVRNENVQAGGSFENEYSYYASMGAINQSSQSEGDSMRKLIIGQKTDGEYIYLTRDGISGYEEYYAYRY